MDAPAGQTEHAPPRGQVDAAALIRFGEAIAFNKALGLKATVVEPGRVEVVLPWSELVTNNYGTVHAVAVAGPAEMAAGLAVITALGATPIASAVARSMDVRYRKPARGELTADARLDAALADDLRAELEASGRVVATVLVPMRDLDGQVVAEVSMDWVVKAREQARPIESTAVLEVGP